MIERLDGEVHARKDFKFWLEMRDWHLMGMSNNSRMAHCALAVDTVPVETKIVESVVLVRRKYTREPIGVSAFTINFLSTVADGKVVECSLTSLWKGIGHDKTQVNVTSGLPIL